MSAAASTSSSSKPTAAGIVQSSDSQQRVIPESRRADGSIRKERKVRPGFTPVEDVVRYRPARVREAEEARKKGIPGRAPSAVAPPDSAVAHPPSSPSSAPTRFGTSEAPRTTWRSNTARTLAASLPPPLSSSSAEKPSARQARQPQASPSGAGSWRNSRLRKAAAPTQSSSTDEPTDTRAEPEAVKSAAAAAKSAAPPDARSSADELAEELNSLRIDRSGLPADT